MRYDEISKIAHAVERSVCMKKKGISYFYNVPNYSINLVRKDALAIEDAKKVKERREKVVLLINEKDKKAAEEKTRQCKKALE